MNEDESSNNYGSLKRKNLVDDDEEGDVLMKGDDINENNNGHLDSNSTGGEYDPGSTGGDYDPGSLDQESSKAGQHADNIHDQNDLIDRAVTGDDDDLGGHHSHAIDQEDGTTPPLLIRLLEHLFTSTAENFWDIRERFSNGKHVVGAQSQECR
jgi:hypothetical protein